MSFHLNLDDITRILGHIRIAERHVASNYTALVDDQGNALNNLVPFGLRTVSGQYNNLVNTEYGSSDQLMPRLLTPQFQGAEVNPRNGAPTSYEQTTGSVYDSQPRTISNLISDQSVNNQAAVIAALTALGSADPYGDAQRLSDARQALADAQAALQTLLQAPAPGPELAALQASYEDAQAIAVADGQAAQAAQAEVNALQAALSAPGSAVDLAQQRLANAVSAEAAADAAASQAYQAYAAAQSGLAGLQDAVADAIAARNNALEAFGDAVVQAAAASANVSAQSAYLNALLADPNSTPEARQAASDHLATLQQISEAADLLVDTRLADFSDAAMDAARSELQLAQAQTTLADASQALFAAMAAEYAAEGEVSAAQQALASAQGDADAAVSDALAQAQAAANAASQSASAADQAFADWQAALQEVENTPEAIAAAEALVQATQNDLQQLSDSLGLQFDVNEKSVLIPNVMPDLGDTAPYNSFLTLFGQFFDHGLDLVSKGGSGTVYIPLQPDDPLYVEGSPTNFMVLTRATNQPGPDGLLGTADDVREHANQTTPWIDLNQVYTSHESHQVFLREYARVEIEPGVFRTMATGHMLEGQTGGPPTWADIKAQARAMLGIELSDFDVHRVPLVAADLYGNFIAGANGYAQLVTPSGLVEGSPDNPLAAGQAYGAGRAFMDDIAHNANPGMVDDDRNPQTPLVATAPDADDVAGNPIVPNGMGVNLEYDNELLDAHYVVGDGRGNENIGLTAVHHVFHSEHNLRVDQIKEEVLASNDLAFINQWLLMPVQTVPTSGEGLVWNGERLFQASRFSTEMVYQHLVFEEFARLVSPDVDPFLFSNTVDIDPAIVAEFAHVVYRFGHSMLNETVDRLAADGQTSDSIGLIQAFLNPVEFVASGADANEAAGAILRGMTRQVGNEIDEFLTEALRNNLVGLPLDLGAINIARGRETGVPPLNEARRQFFEQTNDTTLEPYGNWYDFAIAIKNPASIINFIAAYGTHETILAADNLEDRRAAATLLVMGGDGAPDDRVDFLNATGAWAGDADLGGLNRVDFWIGGLAEKKVAFGGLLGTTFNFVFEVQMEKLQEGDRFYYLSRTQGMNLLNQLEADSFAELVMRNTDLGNPNATHLPSSLFLTPDYILELDRARQKVADPTHTDPVLGNFGSMVIREDLDGDGVDENLRYMGGDHIVIGGTDKDNILIAGEGDDTVWGGKGNDRIEGGKGVDHLFGGEGDDIITDSGVDSGAGDVIHGDDGNDVINPGNGLDLVFGGRGQDFIYGGVDGKTYTAGEGNDFVRGADGLSFVAGNEGDDWLEGGDSFDTLAGDNSELFFNSPIIGHDVLNGRGNDNDYDAESGDDIMFQGPGIQRNNGMAGFDWAIHKGDNQAADSDLGIPIFVNQEANILRDRFDLVEGLSGWNHDDKLTGREDIIGAYNEDAGAAAQFNPDSPFESYANALLQTGVDRIDGLGALVAHLDRVNFTVAGQTHTAVVFDNAAIQYAADGVTPLSIYDTAADILLGGGGSDEIRGLAGNDIIDGDRWLNVRIGVRDANGTVFAWADELGGPVFSNAGAPLYGGRTLDSLMFDRTLNPGQLTIIREILDGDPDNEHTDVAVFRGNRDEYTITRNTDGSLTVAHTNSANPAIDDGTDRLFNIEQLRFADVVVGKPSLDLHAFDAGTYSDQFASAAYGNSNGTATWGTAWTETGDRTGSPATTGEIRIQGGQLEFRQDTGAGSTPAGASITRSVDLSLVGNGTATLAFSWSQTAQNRLDAGESVSVQFTADGQSWVTLDTLGNGSNANGGSFNAALSGPFSASAAVRFVFSGVNGNNETIRIDDVSIAYRAPAQDGNNWQSTFTEDGASVGISSLSGITGSQLLGSARVVLTNPQTGDTLNASGLPNGIGASTALVGGQLVLTLMAANGASAAAFQQALDAVRFNNSSDNPATTPRLIEVTVTDLTTGLASAPALSTVNVVAVDDAMVANNDNVITNHGSGSAFAIQVADLLANDSDPDSALAITAITAQSGLTAPALTNNFSGNAITVIDNAQAGGSFTYRGTGSDTATVTVTRDTNGDLNGTNNADIIVGNAQASTIVGGGGRDVIYGGGGNDTFDYNSTGEVVTVGTVTAANVNQLELIRDWSAGDRIDLSGIDAMAGGGNQAFTFIGSAAFNAANQNGGLRSFQIQDTQGQWFTVIEGSTDNDTTAEFQLALLGQHNLNASDFVL